jgi:serine/threonine-protein kinase
MVTGNPPLSETKDRSRRLSKARFINVTPILEADPSLPSSVALVVNKAMELDVDRRYQTPSALLADLAILARRLGGEGEEESEGEETYETDDERRQRERLAHLANHAEQRRSVMVVESSTEVQNLLREGLKRAGYRVLVMSDPKRVLERFRQEPSAADCVLFNAQQIGRSALDIFNRFGKDKIMRAVPAILILGESQKDWKEKADAEEHRLVLGMPFTLKQLRVTLSKLIEPEVEAGESQPEPAND